MILSNLHKEGNVKKIFLMIFLVLALGLLTGPAWAQQYFQEEAKVLIKVKSYADGSHRMEYYIVEPETGMYVPFWEYADTAGIAAPPVKLQPAVITLSWHWKRPTTITFNVTARSAQKKTRIKKVLNTYMNQRRGTNMVPRMKLGTKKVKIKPIGEFADPAQFYRQLDFDGNNTVVMTTDDQFFLTPPRLGPPVPFDPDFVSMTFIMGRITIRVENGRNVTTYWIDEADVYFLNNFWDMAKNVRNMAGTATFRLALGYHTTIWSHDYMSRKRPHVTAEKFNKKTETPWTLVSNTRDMFYYKDALGVGSIQFLETPRLLPEENEVLDVGGYVLPSKIETIRGEDLNEGGTPIVFLTNLKAYRGSKKLKAKIWRVTTDNPPQDVFVTSMAGNTIRYPTDFSTVKNVYPDIFLCHFRIGQKAKLKKLKKIVKNFGVPVRIDGVDFDKAVKIRVRLSGRLTENGPIKSIERFYWLVDSEPENTP